MRQAPEAPTEFWKALATGFVWAAVGAVAFFGNTPDALIVALPATLFIWWS